MLCLLQNMFDLTMSQALGFSNKKESGVTASSKLNKVCVTASVLGRSEKAYLCMMIRCNDFVCT